MMNEELTAIHTRQIKAEALRLGFSACGIAKAEPVDGVHADAFRDWISGNFNAGMSYMANWMELRLDPRKLMEGCRSVISLALNYSPPTKLPDDRYQFSYYAYGKDYHDVMKRLMRTLQTRILEFAESIPDIDAASLDFRICCDTAPILDRYWAWRSGIGWIGKNTNLIIPHAGSFFFLGEILVNMELEYGSPLEQRCGSCRACIDACPAKALSHPYRLDANRCLSYLTIEAVGAAVGDYDDFETNINFVPQSRINANLIEIGGYEVDLYRFITILLLISAVLAFLIASCINMLLSSSIDNLQTDKLASENDINAFQQRIKQDKTKTTKNIFPVLKEIIDNNASVVNVYIQLATEIPDNVYIKKFVTTPNGGIGILGEAKSSDLVETFVTKLREKNSDLMVSKVSLNSEDSILPDGTERSGLTFEIKTASKEVFLNEQENIIPQAASSQRNNTAPKRRSMNGALTPPPPVI